MGLKIKLVPGDAPVEQGPSAAQTVAQKFVADKNMVGVLGGSTSGSVAATSKTFTQAGLVQVSESATDADAHEGRQPGGDEARSSASSPPMTIQGPTDANYMINTLQGEERRDHRLPGAVLAGPRRPGREGAQGGRRDDVAPVDPEHRRRTSRRTSPRCRATPTSCSSRPRSRGDAQAFASQLAEQGKKAKVFGGDGSNGPGAFKAAGSYVSNFAPQITSIAADKADHRRLEEGQPGQVRRLLRPAGLRRGPGHPARRSSRPATKGHGSIAKRGAIVLPGDEASRSTVGWILGGKFAWSKVNISDPNVTKFYIIQIQSDGSYKLVS